ncbi:MAG: short-chain dehydrogenase/reductase SDR [uncultured bacterium]|nr:MAG: short-chain dehydrogenase/reductase SDR [uncultured bacterium]
MSKNVLIIGGTSGLGQAIALGFARNNNNVIIAGRTKIKIEETKKIFKKEKLAIPFSINMDVSSYNSVLKSAKTYFSKFKTIDVLVCAAGIHLKIPTAEMAHSQWNEIINTNLNGTYYSNQIYGKQMIKQGSGVIINIASLGSRRALSLATAYCVSKSGVEMLTKSLGSEWAVHGIRVNAILPGVFKTPLNQKALSDPERVKNILKCTPMKRFGKVSEIVGAALFLASDEASFVTGTSLAVDGGFLAYSGF